MANAPRVATYTNDPENVVVDRIRFELGDTDCQTAYLSDDEIRFLVTKEDPDATSTDSRLLRAAARGAEAIAAQVARQIDYSHGSVRKAAAKVFEHYSTVAGRLARRASELDVAPEALGVTVAEKEAADLDESRVQPMFRKGIHDNPRTGLEPGSEPSDWVSY